MKKNLSINGFSNWTAALGDERIYLQLVDQSNDSFSKEIRRKVVFPAVLPRNIVNDSIVEKIFLQKLIIALGGNMSVNRSNIASFIMTDHYTDILF